MASAPDMSEGHAWSADEAGAQTLTDRLADMPITIGSAGWSASAEEEPALSFPGQMTLSSYWKDAVGHAVDVDAVPGFRFEVALGQLGRYEAGLPQPSGTQLLYACVLGAANMISKSSGCEHIGVRGRPLGYSWTSASAVPAGHAAREIFRCRLGGDYFLSPARECVGGAAVEGSFGYLLVHDVTSTIPGAIDTTKSFTISARVDPRGGTAAQTVVTGSGASDSPFSLQAGTRWQFCLRSQGPTLRTACTTGPTVASTPGYSTVSGVWDAVNPEIRIVVKTDAKLTVDRVNYEPPADDIPAVGAIVLGSSAPP